MNIKYKFLGYFLVVASLFLQTSCTDQLSKDNNLTPEQKALIGRAVVFKPSVRNLVTKAYNHDDFNIGDVMYIFRQSKDASGSFNKEEDWKSYKYNGVVDETTGAIILSQWEINLDRNAGFRNTTQSAADSIFWENGESVRFRAYAKSCLYNDYMYADFANVSGPVSAVPLEFKHLGCRIGFVPCAGNELRDIFMCLDKEDYMQIDNADTREHDNLDILPEDEAIEVAAAVTEAYNKMCMAGGVQMYSNATNNKYAIGSDTEVENPLAQFGRLTAQRVGGGEVFADEVTVENTVRPNWNSSLDGCKYMICVPYEMNGINAGSPITLPAKTRFKIKLYDVNDPTTMENKFHIFSLEDVVDEHGNKVYKDGMTLQPGYAFTFAVGYEYKQLVVKSLNENTMSWDLASPVELSASASEVTNVTPKFNWWNGIMNKAADDAMADDNAVFKPVFKINTLEQWEEFLKIVNGDIPQPTTVTTPDGETLNYDGCIAYKKFIPNNGAIEKNTVDAYLTSAYDFKGFEIVLNLDLDFQEKNFKTLGTADTPFSGIFNGNGNTIKNFVGTLFNYTKKATIKGLQLESKHKISLINEAVDSDVMGIFVKAPSDCAIAQNSKNCTFRACCHIGVGSSNGPLFKAGSNNKAYGCFIAASGNGVLTQSSCFGEFTGCYYDKTLSPVAGTVGSNTSDEIFVEYGARGVISSVLKAVEDNNESPEMKEFSYDTYYGTAPFSVMNEAVEVDKYGYEYVVKTAYDDRYPTLKLK